jgi:hypothetical protein
MKKNARSEKKVIPKNRQKIHMLRSFSAKGLIGVHTFRNIMDGAYYVQILKNHLLRGAKDNLELDGSFNKIMMQSIHVEKLRISFGILKWSHWSGHRIVPILIQ